MAHRRRSVLLCSVFAALALTSSMPQRNLEVVTIDAAAFLYLDDVIRAFELEHSFDMISQKGRLYANQHTAAYAVGLSVMLVDGHLYRSSRPVTRKAGRVLLPLDAAEYLIKCFHPEIELERRGGSLEIRIANWQEGDAQRDQEEERRDHIRFVVIDPGHGGKDPGAVGKGGIREKDITLKVARALEKKIRAAYPDLRVILTRKDDRFVELAGRTALANRQLKKGENGIFLSIHVNSSLSSKVSGYETFFLSQNPTNDEARSTAALENNVIMLEDSRGESKGRDDVDYIEAIMITTQIQKESAMLADAIQRGMAKRNRSFSSRGVKKADFFVLRGVLMPAALVEIGYISNRKEATMLTNREHQEAIARGISDGLGRLITQYNRMVKNP